MLKPDASVTEQALIDFVTAHKGVVCAPKSVSFETALPLTSLGKLDKKSLRARYWGGQDRQVS